MPRTTPQTRIVSKHPRSKQRTTLRNPHHPSHNLTSFARKVHSFISHNVFYVSGSHFPHKRDKNPIGGLWKGLHNPYVALVVAFLIWGVTAPISKLTLTEIGPFTLLFFRTIIASLILLPFIFKHKVTFTLREQIFVALAALFEIFLHITLIYLALPLIPSINLPIIGSMSPFFLVLMARIFLREKANVNKYYGMGFGLMGVLCITVLPALFAQSGQVLGISTEALSTLRILGLQGYNISPSGVYWLGNGLLVLGVIVGSIGPIFLKPIRHFPAQLITFWQFALVACFTLPFALLESPQFVLAKLTSVGIVGIIYLSVLSSVVAYSLYTHGLQESKAADVGLFSYLSPISALIVGIPLLHEYPNFWFIIGAALVLTGLWIAERNTRNRSRKTMKQSRQSPVDRR